MPLVATYSYETFVTFLQNVVQPEIASDLGWTDITDGGAYDGPINECLRAMGYATVEAVPTSAVGELEARGEVAIWEKAVSVYVRAYDAGGAARTLSRDQLFQHARYMLERAEAALATLISAETDETDRGLINGTGYSTSIPIRVGFPRLYG